MAWYTVYDDRYNAAIARGDWAAAQQAVFDRNAEAARIATANNDWHKANNTGPYAATSSNDTSSSAPAAAPSYPKFVSMKISDKNVKVAPSDIIQWDDSNTTIAMMENLLFEDIGAVELANISRTDLIDGQETIYSPIKNLSTIRRDFNPNNIIFTISNNDYFTRFGIDLLSKNIYEPYFDENGDLVIEIENIANGEQVEIEILSNGTIDLVDEA